MQVLPFAQKKKKKKKKSRDFCNTENVWTKNKERKRMHGHASTVELKISFDYKIENWFTSSNCIVKGYDKNKSYRAHKTQFIVFFL